MNTNQDTTLTNQDEIKPIEYDAEMDRFYIPVNSRYEIQTKGNGSSFRIANKVTHPALQHAVKKLLVAGGRGHKDITKDVNEAIDSCNRFIEMEKEDNNE